LHKDVISMLVIAGVVLAAVSTFFLQDILKLFGATEAVMPYAIDYTGIIAIGLPFAMFSTGFNSIIRADGNPKFAMLAMLSGALLNTILDPLFIFGFGMGVKGAASVYGSEIPLSVFGIVTKVNQIMLSVLLGIAVGAQPILGFNYGAGKMKRVKETVKTALIAGALVAFTGLICFEFFPRQITNLFGSGDALYHEFAVMYFRIFLAGCVLNAIQIVYTIFFQAIGKPSQAGILSLSRQIIFYIPSLFIIPMVFGVKGAIYAGPIADILAFILTVILMKSQWKKMSAE